MRIWRLCGLLLVACSAVAAWSIGPAVGAAERDPGPEQAAIEGTFVRVVWNDEGWLEVGYRIANQAVGEPWMVLDVGMTIVGGDAVQTIARDDITLVTPDGQVVQLATQDEFEKARGELLPLVKRAAMTGDPIDDFPTGADQPCRIRFFADPGAPRPMKVDDEIELASSFACVGRLFFEVPGGIQVGNYNLDVRFSDSTLKVPLEIMTEEREREFVKQWKDTEKQSKQ